MGFFSSKSKSTSNQSTTTTTTSNQASVGDLAHDNVIVSGGELNYNPVGIAGEELATLTEFILGGVNSAQNLVSDSINMISTRSSEESNYLGSTIEKMTLPIIILGSVFLVIFLGKKK